MKLGIKKFFNKEPEKIQESSVEFKVELTPEERKALFDDAVRDAVRGKIREVLFKQLIEMSNDPEKLRQEAEFLSLPKKELRKDRLYVLQDNYPKLKIYSSARSPCCYIYKSEFCLEGFLDKLVEDI